MEAGTRWKDSVVVWARTHGGMEDQGIEVEGMRGMRGG